MGARFRRRLLLEELYLADGSTLFPYANVSMAVMVPRGQLGHYG